MIYIQKTLLNNGIYIGREMKISGEESNCPRNPATRNPATPHPNPTNP